tara:strand:- start:36 stop:230 length:195 start_codon:yes stop_codon:yes gene_type:complete
MDDERSYGLSVVIFGWPVDTFAVDRLTDRPTMVEEVVWGFAGAGRKIGLKSNFGFWVLILGKAY